MQLPITFQPKPTSESKVMTLRCPCIILPCLKRTQLLQVSFLKLLTFRLIRLLKIPLCNLGAIFWCQPFPLHEISIVVTPMSLNSLLVQNLCNLFSFFDGYGVYLVYHILLFNRGIITMESIQIRNIKQRRYIKTTGELYLISIIVKLLQNIPGTNFLILQFMISPGRKPLLSKMNHHQIPCTKNLIPLSSIYRSFVQLIFFLQLLSYIFLQLVELLCKGFSIITNSITQGKLHQMKNTLRVMSIKNLKW